MVKSTQSRQSLSLDGFLVAVASRDLQGNFVVPKDDVAERLAQEIGERTGMKSRNLSGKSGLQTTRLWVSATPRDFAIQTRRAVQDASRLLCQNAAKTFDIAFHNTQQPPNEWGDKVLFAIRYARAA